MSIRVMIIDGQADFRTLLMHHVTTNWPEAGITSFDPRESGFLPDEFSGAGNDLVLFGDDYGERDALDAIASFSSKTNFPPIAYFGQPEHETAALAAGSDLFFERGDIRHGALVEQLENALQARRRGVVVGDASVTDDDERSDPQIRGYRLLEEISVSSHASIYRAERESTGEQVALKVLRQVPDVADDIAAFDRFLQEYELIAEIDHPNIVGIHDLGVGDEHAHIVMEYLGGGNLKDRIRDGVSEEQAVRYVQQVAGALGRIHEAGILHRDLKPGNVMFRADDSVALIDFGLARYLWLQMELTKVGEIFGTPHYMSPEQGHGAEVDHRSDIYSLGVIFYELLTGERPFHADTAMGVIYMHAQSPVPELPAGLAKYQALLNVMLAKDPDERLQTAEEVLECL